MCTEALGNLRCRHLGVVKAERPELECLIRDLNREFTCSFRRKNIIVKRGHVKLHNLIQ